MNQFTPGARGRYLNVGIRVRVNHPESWYHGETGIVNAKGRYGCWIVQIVKDGKVYTPEIARGYLEPVQEGESNERTTTTDKGASN